MGSKWSITGLKKYYTEHLIDSEILFKKIEDVIIKTLVTVEPY